MTPTGIPLEIKKFIFEYFDSVSELEVLLLIYSQKNLQWDGKKISENLRSSEWSANSILKTLFDHGFLVKPDGVDLFYQYSPKSKKLSHLVDQLALVYPTYRVAIITLIYEKPAKEARSFYFFS